MAVGEDTGRTTDTGGTSAIDSAEPEDSGSTEWPLEIGLEDASFARILGDTEGLASGETAASVGDFDGDGVLDVVLGAPNFDWNVGARGAVHLVPGPFSGEVLLSTVAGRVEGTEHGDSAGIDLAHVGDVDGDGLSDFAVGSDSNDEWVAVLCGSSPKALSLSSPCGRLTGTGRFGRTISAMGDLDGDGLSELVVGDPMSGAVDGSAGAAFLFTGPLDRDGTDADATASFLGITRYEYVATDLAADGDVNGDGLNDILLGGSGDGHATPGNVGGLYLFLAPHVGTNLTSEASDAYDGDHGDGWSTSIYGDLDGDGYDDVVCGVETRDTADVVAAIFPGSATGTDMASGSPDATISDTAVSDIYDRWAYQSEGLGDLDGDGADELGLAALGLTDRPALWVFRGPLSGALSVDDADQALYGDPAWGPTAGRLVPGGDLDDDGRDDILLGYPTLGVGADGGGGAYLLSGATLFD